MMRFFFTQRFNRFDVAVVVIATTVARHSLTLAVGIILAGFMLSATGELLLNRSKTA